jgi:Ni,Fe-hydrogenase III small subunit
MTQREYELVLTEGQAGINQSACNGCFLEVSMALTMCFNAELTF